MTGAGSTTLFHDARGNITRSERLTGARLYATDYAYAAAADRVTSVTYPSGRVVDYAYDAASRVASIKMRETAGSAQTTLMSGIDYFPMASSGSTGVGGRVGLWGVEEALLGNGLTLAAAYDSDGRLSALSYAPGAGPAVHALAFGYDAASNVSGVTDAVAPARNETFQYDLVGRLTQASGVYGTIAVAYDKVGNRETLSWDQGGSLYQESYAYGAGSHRLTQVTGGGGSTTRVMGYDAAGSLTTDEKGGTTYAYVHDGAGRLVEARNGATPFATYAYDAFEQRVLKTTTAAAPGGASSVHFIHDQYGRLLAEHDGATGAPLREYVWLGLIPVVYVDHSSGAPLAYWVLADQVGEPQKLANAAGAVVWDRVATPWGQEVSVTGSLTQPLRFPGQRHDAETSFAQNWHRDYDPSLGRYIQSDPIGLMGGISTYGYVGGNPVNRTDRTGLIAPIAIAGLCAGGACEAGLAGLAAAAAWATSGGPEQLEQGAADAYAAYCSKCESLYAEINQLTNELKKRQGELGEDALGLPATGPFSIAGHQHQFEGKQRRLRRKLFEAFSLGCTRVNPDAWRMATKPAPAPMP